MVNLFHYQHVTKWYCQKKKRKKKKIEISDRNDDDVIRNQAT